MQKGEIKDQLGTLEIKYETNPFIVDLKGKMFLQPRANAIIAKGQSIVDTSTGEIIDESVLIGRRKVVDKSQFAKIYASEIGVLYELSKTAQNVFLYLTKVMDYENKAYFNYNLHFNKLNYKSKTPALKGLRELIGKNIIAPHENIHNYWLNPTIVCKGERFAMYTEYVIGKDGEAVKADSQLKAQARQMYSQMPEQIENKLNKANNESSLFNSENENPYQTNLLDQINELDNDE